MISNSVDAKVNNNRFKFFPNFKNKELATKIKIKHLLTHSSGLPDNRNVKNDIELFGSHPEKAWKYGSEEVGIWAQKESSTRFPELLKWFICYYEYKLLHRRT